MEYIYVHNFNLQKYWEGTFTTFEMQSSLSDFILATNPIRILCADQFGKK